MQYRHLGSTDIKVSAIGFGCWALAGGFNWGHQEEKDSIAALRTAYDSGITLVDTAEGYGRGASEQILTKGLSGVRQDIIIATKVSTNHFQEADLIQACERSLKNLNTDYIDLYQLHFPKKEFPVDQTLGVLDRLKHQGKIRAFGVSNFGIQRVF